MTQESMSDTSCVQKLRSLLIDIGLVSTTASTETVYELLTAIVLDNQEDLLNIWHTETVRQAELIRQKMKDDIDSQLLGNGTGTLSPMQTMSKAFGLPPSTLYGPLHRYERDEASSGNGFRR
jgi:hypothetical protein